MTPGKRKALNKNKPSHALRDKLEKLNATIRAKLENPLLQNNNQPDTLKTTITAPKDSIFRYGS